VFDFDLERVAIFQKLCDVEPAGRRTSPSNCPARTTAARERGGSTTSQTVSPGSRPVGFWNVRRKRTTPMKPWLQVADQSAGIVALPLGGRSALARS
jgi:hypothetical protein